MDRTKENSRKLIVFFGLFVVFYAAFLIFSYVMKSRGYEYPAGDFRFFRHDVFKDFATINNAVCDRNPYLSNLSNYPPIILMIAYIFTKFADYSGYDIFTLRFAYEDPKVFHSILVLMISCAVAFFAVCMFHAYLQNRGESKKTFKERVKRFLIAGGIAIALIFSAPSVFLFDRGNYLAITVVFFLLWAVFEEEKPDSVLGAVFAALCAATKVYPIYILLIYLFEKKFKKFFWAMATGAVVTLVPILFFRGGYIDNVRAFINGVLGFGGGSGLYSVYFTVGITGFTGFMMRIFGFLPNARYIKMVWVLMGASMTLLCMPFLKDEKTRWKKLLVLTAVMVYLTPNSYLYNTAYMFAPIFVMLMNRDRMVKKDYVYVIISALLLVPKAYYYIPDIMDEIPLEYNTISIAVLIDSFLYFLIIAFYIGEKVIELAKSDRKLLQGNPISSFSYSKKQKILLTSAVGLAFAAAAFTMFWLVRDTVLACHDSIFDFIEAKVLGASIGYKRAFEFGLARGRVGFIFPLVVLFRYFVNANGNFVAIWLLQYVPILLNIGLITYIISRKISPVHGSLFALLFTAFLQIDIWHSLITSYPLDFMYGLFIMILGLYLYSEYLEKRTSGKKLNIIRLIISVFLYYESMQVYESFIMSSLIYAIIAFVYAKRECKDIKGGIRRFIISLLPHFITAVIYLGIMFWLRSHPVVDIAVSKIEKTGFKSFILPYIVFTIGMFPLVGARILGSIKEIFIHFSRRGVIFGFFTAIGFLALSLRLMVRFRSLNGLERKKEFRRIITFFFMGLIFALTFAIPHAMIPSYQEWVNVGHVGGYVPTTICYFGWAVALTFVFVGLVYCASYRTKRFRVIFLSLMTLFCYVAAFITFAINVSYRSYDYVTGTQISLRAQTFYAAMNDEWIKENKPVVLYSPDISGVHYLIETDEEYAEKVLGYDIELLNDQAGAARAFKDYKNTCLYKYDLDSTVCMFIRVYNVNAPADYWATSKEIRFITPYEGTFTVSYKRLTGQTETITIDLDEGETITLADGAPVFYDSIDVERVS